MQDGDGVIAAKSALCKQTDLISDFLYQNLATVQVANAWKDVTEDIPDFSDISLPSDFRRPKKVS